ncbi:hypothetical protein IEQ34_004665 [Dendrobium chrysotoxum]|uniref:Uncharacterized protein n=1 Tax=Dendrobium chrysotoxum TaxID=161865 RepID=A0AAV7HEW9_DENCH|nr:hypothetical protein IEQ34_004665 [Dendrobium chrysotoxum]
MLLTSLVFFGKPVIQWILFASGFLVLMLVIEFYQFNPVTAYRSVDYLDRFLSANSLPVVVHPTIAISCPLL